MVAEHVATRPTPVLLCEPIKPAPGDKWGQEWAAVQGWSRRGPFFVRRHGDDAWGATVQEMIVRYLINGVERKTLAREYGLSERQVQAYLSGNAWRPYGLALLGLLERMGVSLKRRGRDKRHERIADAMLRRAEDIVLLLKDDQRPLAREIVADLAVLVEARRLARITGYPTPNHRQEVS